MLDIDTAQRNTIAGRVVVPGDAGWDEARRAFNLLVDQQPDAIAFPADELDVMRAVDFARDRGLRIAPQATGHNAGPLGSLQNTVLVNTGELTGSWIAATAQRMRVGAATRWGSVTPNLSMRGLAALHGSSPDVGVVGYALGGGMGWLARKFGLQANSVTAVELVTADGKLTRTDAQHDPDLFWALRGGGGSFGVVTAIEFAVYPVEELYAGAMFFPFERSREVLHTWNEMLPSLPDELMSWACLMHLPELPFIPEPLRGNSFAVVLAAFLGDEDDGRRLLRPVRELGPAIDTFSPVEPAALGGLAMDPPDPLPYRSTHRLLDDLSADAIDRLVDAAPRSSQVAVVQVRHMGGALARPPMGAGARATLPGTTCMFALGMVTDPDADATLRSSLSSLDSIFERYHAGYYPSFVEEPADVRQYFDETTWNHLTRVKATYDPMDLFRGNHHVPPGANP